MGYPTKITWQMVDECMAEISEDGQEGVWQLIATFEENYRHLPRAKAFGPKSGQELVGALARYLSRPMYEKYGLLMRLKY